MKNTNRVLSTVVIGLFLVLAGVLGYDTLLPVVYAQQNTLTQTYLSAAITPSQNSIAVHSATGITVTNNTTATILYVDREEMVVLAVNGTQLTVSRGQGGTPAAGHVSGANVLAGNPTYFFNHDPQGSCTAASTLATPYVNVISGNQWLCSTVTLQWVPGFNNPGFGAVPIQETASVTGATITPSGPYAQFTGTTALVTINVPIGCGTQVGGCTVTLDFVGSGSGLTWTNAGNIAVAGSVTAASSVTFRYDPSLSTAKWVPSRTT